MLGGVPVRRRCVLCSLFCACVLLLAVCMLCSWYMCYGMIVLWGLPLFGCADNTTCATASCVLLLMPVVHYAWYYTFLLHSM